jgi:hypothetical protein
MKANVRLTDVDGHSTDVVIALPDFIAWEKQSKRKTSDLVEAWGLDDWAWLAWRSQTRTRDTSDKFDDWVGRMVELELLPDQPVPSRGGA